ECDVRLTRDGHLVCIHDRRLDRVSDGTGHVSRQYLSQLNELDFGSWHTYPEGGAPVGVRTPVLTLDELLTTATGAGRPLRLFVETKHPTRYGAMVEDRLMELLAKYGLDAPGPDAPVRVTVMSFSALAVRRLRKLAPKLDVVFLTELAYPVVRDGRLPFGTRI